MSISNRHSFYTLIVIATLSGLGILWFDYAVLLPSIATTSKLVTQTRQEIVTMDQRNASLSRAQKEFEDALAQKETLDIITSFPDGLAFINFIEKVAQHSGNTLTFTVAAGETPTFRVQLNGSFSSLTLFLRQMSVAPTDIQLFAIVAGSHGDQGALLTSDISLTPILSSSQSNAKPDTK